MSTELIAIPGEEGAWRIGDTEFVETYRRGSTADRLCIQKDQALLDLYVELCPEFRGGRIVELGIAAGGGTALLALLAEPKKLVACDVTEHPVAALSRFLERKSLTDTVRPYYGVDQTDRHQLEGVLGLEFGDESLDLVIDDASHQWDRTVASFEVLFPRLRPGGLFVIEDWAAHYVLANGIAALQADPTSDEYAAARAEYDDKQARGVPPRPPLARIGVELLLASSSSPDVITQVGVNQHWISVRRGPAELDLETFRLADLYDDAFGWLAEEPGDWWLDRLWAAAGSATISSGP